MTLGRFPCLGGSPMYAMLMVLFFSPGSIIGFMVGMVVVAIYGNTRWKKPTGGLWILAAFLNAPTCIILLAFVFPDNPGLLSLAFVATLLIYFFGTFGFGFAVLFFLLCRAFALRREIQSTD
jgi:hypothetical protein